jgi:membrane protein DedA with SNARE-associated domain
VFRWITDLVSHFGYGGVGLLMFLENVFPPIPSELIMPLAGFVARRGELNLGVTIAAGTVGSLAGASFWYVLGRRLGERRLRAWIERHGHWLGLSADDIDRSARWFRRHGPLAVTLGRLVPGVRTLISVPAGIAGMRALPFLLFTIVGTALWTAALSFAGYLLGARYGRVTSAMDATTWIVFAAMVAAYLIRLVRVRRKASASS